MLKYGLMSFKYSPTHGFYLRQRTKRRFIHNLKEQKG